MPAIPAHSTPVREGSGDCTGYRSDAPNEREILRHVHAIVRSGEDFDPDEKQSYALPHHPPQAGSAADLVCVRAALSRLPQTQGISDEERAGAERHLRRHLNAAEQEDSVHLVDPDAITVDVDGQQVSLRTLARGLDEVRVAHEMATSFQLSQIEVRTSGAGNGQYTVSGYASVTDQWYDLWPGVRERIASEAFDDVLAADPDVHALWDHDTRFVLARTRNRTLDLSKDERGLRFWARVADTSYGRDLRTLLERGDVDQASFAFTVAEDGDAWKMREENGQTVIERTINQVEGLFDVTVTAKGANPLTSSGVARSAVRAALDRSPRGAAQASSVAAPPQPAGLDERDAPSPQPAELDDSPTEQVEVSNRVEHLRARIAERQAALKGLKRRTEKFRD